jgi:23S rRNA (cytosine1962-C5)-methyltransferase
MRQSVWPLEAHPSEHLNAYRLVYAESDELPGLIVDRYADLLVMQCLSAGAERWRETIADLLREIASVRDIYERSDADVRELEGLGSRCGVLRGAEPPTRLQIVEGALTYWVDIRQGHKTGFYLDQRHNRQRVLQLSNRREVLDCFSYTGGFALSSLAGGAQSIIAVESSSDAVALAKDNLALNRLSQDRLEWIENDVFSTLRKLRDRGEHFDLIVLDPPKFAPTGAQVERASRGYKDINLLAFKLLRPGGILVTFSCSGGISAELFQKIIFGAALDAGVEAQIIAHLFQGFDHPVALNFPEGAYLKGLVLRIK